MLGIGAKTLYRLLHGHLSRGPQPGTVSLLSRLVRADLTIDELADSFDLSLADLADWIERPGRRELLERLIRLSDLRAQLLLSRYRANAALQLIAIASSEKPTEISRKACVDLIKADLQPVELGEPKTDASEPPAAPSEEAILNALQQLGDDGEVP